MRGGSIAVVGGSIAGCAAALAASRGGAGKITVFERADARLRDRGWASHCTATGTTS